MLIELVMKSWIAAFNLVGSCFLEEVDAVVFEEDVSGLCVVREPAVVRRARLVRGVFLRPHRRGWDRPSRLAWWRESPPFIGLA